MKKNMKILNLVVLVISLGLISCQNNEVVAQNHMVTQVEWKKLLNEVHHHQIIDVRTPEEFNEGHLKGAVNIDFYAKDFQEQINKLDKNVPAFVYCHSGGRSEKASELMFQSGFVTIYDLQGGYSTWEE